MSLVGVGKTSKSSIVHKASNCCIGIALFLRACLHRCGGDAVDKVKLQSGSVAQKLPMAATAGSESCGHRNKGFQGCDWRDVARNERVAAGYRRGCSTRLA